jgi:hypothetical protein
MNTRTPIPGTSSSVAVPADWQTSTGSAAGLISVEPAEGRFAANVTVLLDTAPRLPLPEAVAAVTAPLVAPVLVDVQGRDDGFDLVICHLAGPLSVTARQRQVVVAEGLLVVTFTAATSRWSELCGLAGEVLDSIGAAA